MTIEKFAFLQQVTSSAGTGDGWILQCALFREPIAQHCGTKQKAPGLRRGLLLIRQDSAYRLTWTLAPTGARAAAAGAFTAGDNLDPERVLALVVRGGAGLAQRIQAVLRRTRGCSGESRQLEDHPRAAIQFAEARATDGLSVVTLISVPARMLVSPVRVNSLPLRLRTTGG